MTNTVNLTQTHRHGTYYWCFTKWPCRQTLIELVMFTYMFTCVYTYSVLLSTLAGDISCCRGQWLVQEFTTGQNTKNGRLQVLSPRQMSKRTLPPSLGSGDIR